MADQNRRSYRTYESPQRPEPSQGQYANAGSDPLAELARLIGQTDPFAERERTARAEAAAEPVYEHAPEPAYEQPREPVYEQSYEQPYAPVQAAPYAAQQGEGYPPPGYDPYYGADQGALDEAEYQEELSRRRRQWRLATVLGIVGLAVLGAASAYGYRTYFVHTPHGSSPPVIMADTGPTKVVPVAKASDASANKLSYERVGEPTKSEKVVPREEKPVDVKAVAVTPPRVIHEAPEPATTATTSPVATIPVSAEPAKGADLPTASSTVPNGSGVILPSPRKVKTLTIRPDMSIVGDVNAASAPAPVVAPPARVPAPAAPVQASVPMRSVKLAPSHPAPTNVVATAPRPERVEPPSPAQHMAAPVHAARGAMMPLSLSPGGVEPAAVRSASPAPRAPVALASASASVPAAAPAAAAGGGFAVQVSSQRSEADAKASFKALQSRYPNVLGSRQPYVKRADLGAKGVYYRTLVGPFASADQAAAFCTSLKAAGGQCLIHRN